MGMGELLADRRFFFMDYYAMANCISNCAEINADSLRSTVQEYLFMLSFWSIMGCRRTNLWPVNALSGYASMALLLCSLSMIASFPSHCCLFSQAHYSGLVCLHFIQPGISRRHTGLFTVVIPHRTKGQRLQLLQHC